MSLLRQLSQEGVVCTHGSVPEEACQAAPRHACIEPADYIAALSGSSGRRVRLWPPPASLQRLRRHAGVSRIHSGISHVLDRVGRYRAQTDLENVVGSYGPCGGVPSGFPTPVFEISWSLIGSGFSVQVFHDGHIHVISEYLRKAIGDQGALPLSSLTPTTRQCLCLR